MPAGPDLSQRLLWMPCEARRSASEALDLIRHTMSVDDGRRPTRVQRTPLERMTSDENIMNTIANAQLEGCGEIIVYVPDGSPQYRAFVALSQRMRQRYGSTIQFQIISGPAVDFVQPARVRRIRSFGIVPLADDRGAVINDRDGTATVVHAVSGGPAILSAQSERAEVPTFGTAVGNISARARAALANTCYLGDLQHYHDYNTRTSPLIPRATVIEARVNIPAFGSAPCPYVAFMQGNVDPNIAARFATPEAARATLGELVRHRGAGNIFRGSQCSVYAIDPANHGRTLDLGKDEDMATFRRIIRGNDMAAALQVFERSQIQSPTGAGRPPSVPPLTTAQGMALEEAMGITENTSIDVEERMRRMRTLLAQPVRGTGRRRNVTTPLFTTPQIECLLCGSQYFSEEISTRARNELGSTLASAPFERAFIPNALGSMSRTEVAAVAVRLGLDVATLSDQDAQESVGRNIEQRRARAMGGRR